MLNWLWIRIKAETSPLWIPFADSPRRLRALKQIVIVIASALLAIIAFYQFVMWSISLGAKIGDWLNFLGGAFGASLAVMGALWIERRRQHKEKIDKTQPLHDIINDLMKAFIGVSLSRRLSMKSLRACLETCISAAKIFAEERPHRFVTNPLRRDAFEKLASKLIEISPTLTGHLALMAYDESAPAINRATAAVWEPLGEIFHRLDSAVGAAGIEYPRLFPWGWAVEPNSLCTETVEQ